jgi:hypothetical protein
MPKIDPERSSATRDVKKKNCNIYSTPGLGSYNSSIPRIQNLAQVIMENIHLSSQNGQHFAVGMTCATAVQHYHPTGRRSAYMNSMCLKRQFITHSTVMLPCVPEDRPFFPNRRAACYRVKPNRTNLTSNTTTATATNTTADLPNTTTHDRLYLRSTLFLSLKESFALRTSRHSVSCIHRTVGRSIRDSQSQLGIPLPAFNDNDKQRKSNSKCSTEEKNTER